MTGHFSRYDVDWVMFNPDLSQHPPCLREYFAVNDPPLPEICTDNERPACSLGLYSGICRRIDGKVGGVEGRRLLKGKQTVQNTHEKKAAERCGETHRKMQRKTSTQSWQK
eukprot:9785662-Ditylum_brightwellii.AAC.1